MPENQEFPGIEYCIFDMDGLLKIRRRVDIDTRSDRVVCLWITQRIISKVMDEILGRYGCEYSWEIKSATMGKVQHEANRYIYDRYPALADKLSMDDFVVERNQKQKEMFANVQPMKGAVELVEHLHSHGIPIALATSSRDAVFRVKSSNLAQLFDAFPADSIITADSKEVANGRGKPCPDIYLAAARSLGRKVGYAEKPDSEVERIERSKGLVFEDAVLGVEAGVRAGMNVIWVPDVEVRAANPQETYGAKVVLASLSDFKPELWTLPQMPR